MQQSEHNQRVEKYGWPRGAFPVTVYGHRVDVLKNDAHFKEDGRLFFHLTLYCRDCLADSGISHRLPDDEAEPLRQLAKAKDVAFKDFKYTDCE